MPGKVVVDDGIIKVVVNRVVHVRILVIVDPESAKSDDATAIVGITNHLVR